MARAGRLPTLEHEQLVNVIGLMNKHVEMLDRVIRERSERDFKCVVVTEPERRVIDEVGYLGHDARAADLIFQLGPPTLRAPLPADHHQPALQPDQEPRCRRKRAGPSKPYRISSGMVPRGAHPNRRSGCPSAPIQPYTQTREARELRCVFEC